MPLTGESGLHFLKLLSLISGGDALTLFSCFSGRRPQEEESGGNMCLGGADRSGRAASDQVSEQTWRRAACLFCACLLGSLLGEHTWEEGSSGGRLMPSLFLPASQEERRRRRNTSCFLRAWEEDVQEILGLTGGGCCGTCLLGLGRRMPGGGWAACLLYACRLLWGGKGKALCLSHTWEGDTLREEGLCHGGAWREAAAMDSGSMCLEESTCLPASPPRACSCQMERLPQGLPATCLRNAYHRLWEEVLAWRRRLGECCHLYMGEE